jgi:hypothetical protein
MAIATFSTALQVQSWASTMQKELIRRSPWEQMSNLTVETQEIPTRKDMKMVPDAVLIKMGGEFDEGSYQLTIPLVGKLNAKGVFGRQPAEGQEESPALKFKAVHYNVERKPISVQEMSVDGQFDKFYKIGAKGTPMLTTYFMEMTDFNCHRSIVEGASWALTETLAWTGGSITTPPQTRKYNPSVYARGKTAAATYSTTLATYEGNIQTYIDSLTTASNPFSLVGLDALVNTMALTLLPLSWKGDVDYVLLLSDFQCRELQDSTSTTGWSALTRAADPREYGASKTDESQTIGANRAITGILGIYRRTLIINNGRSPIWDTSKAANGYVGYFKPWTSGGFQNAADVAITRTAKTTTGAGTCEIAIGLGKGAIGNPIVKNLGFDEQMKDYNFNKGVCGSRMAGWVRMDFDIATPTTTSIQNQTSLLYFTPTPSTVY